MNRYVPVLAASARIALGGVLVVAAAAKYLSYEPSPVDRTFGLQAFASLIARQGVIPASMAQAAAVATFFVEIALGTWLFAHVAPRGAALTGATLLGVFSVYLGTVYVHGLDVNCGCFGTVTGGGLAVSLARNGALIGLALFGAWGAQEPGGAAAAKTVPVC